MEDESDDESTFLKRIKESLTQFPLKITTQLNLKDLILSYNNLTQIPSEIGNLTALQNLKLDNNNLIILPPEIGNLIALKILVLNNNKLTALPAEIVNLIHLHTINVSSNNLNYDVIPIIRRLKANGVGANGSDLTDLSIHGNPIVFPIDIKKMTENEVAYVSISTHGNIPLDLENKPLLFTPTIHIEVQHACSISAVNYLNRDDTEAISSFIKKNMEQCIPGEDCHFSSDFIKSCKKTEGNPTCRISDADKDDPDYRRFARNLHNRWKPGKSFSPDKKMGNKYFSISSFEYFKEILVPNFSKVMLYTTHGDFDITRFLLQPISQINFFEYEINYLGRSNVLNNMKRLHFFDLKTLTEFFNNLGYKYLKILDLTCAGFVNEKFKYEPEEKNFIQIKGDLKTLEKIKSIESHFGGRKKTRRLNKRKTKKYRKQSRKLKSKPE